MTPDSDLVEDYLDYLSTIRSAKTARSYGRTVRIAHRELPCGLPTARPSEIAAWLARYTNPSTHRTYVSGLRHFANWAVKAGRVEGNAAAKVSRAPQPESLPNPCEDSELAAILAGVGEPFRTWSLIAAYGGARCVEVSRLAREQITVERMQLHGKRDKLRKVPTHELVWVAARDLDPGPVAGGHDSDYVSNRLRYEYLKLGVDVKPHQLRHWYGTTLVKEGAGIEEVKQLMGHSRLSTTLGYVLVASSRLTAAVKRLPTVS